MLCAASAQATEAGQGGRERQIRIHQGWGMLQRGEVKHDGIVPEALICCMTGSCVHRCPTHWSNMV